MKQITIRAGKRKIKVRYADSFFDEARGLMFSLPLKDEGLVLECSEESKIASAIHMLFVFYPIDAVWLDKEKKIVDIKSVFPFTPFSMPRQAAKFVLELPVGYGKKFKIGEKLNF